MAWLESYQQGSFRGAKFLTQSHQAEGGRRAALHEYPDRDLPWSEDLGRRARRWSLECLVAGEDYIGQRDALVSALEARGPGLLVHPWLGQIEVSASNFRFGESTEEGGLARFSIEFQESGRKAAGGASLDSAASARSLAGAVQDAAPARFAAKFSVAGLPAWAEAGAAGEVVRFAASAQSAARLLGGAGPLLRAYEDGLRALDGAVTLVRSPLTLAANVRAMVRAVGALGTSPLARLRSLLRMFESGRLPQVVIGSTPARSAERANGRAFAGLVAQTSGAEAVRALSQVRFSSYQEAAALREELATALDEAALAMADGGDDDLAASLDALRVAAVRDVAARAATLARLTLHVPLRTLPVLAIAQRLYGAPLSLGELADGLVARNRLRHPVFAPGGMALEVLAGELAAGGTRG